MVCYNELVMASNVVDDSDLSSDEESQIGNCDEQNKICDAAANIDSVESVLQSFGLQELIASFNSNLFVSFCLLNICK